MSISSRGRVLDSQNQPRTQPSRSEASLDRLLVDIVLPVPWAGAEPTFNEVKAEALADKYCKLVSRMLKKHQHG